ncbi:hypothetical protein J4211_05830 [Candidatus Woesearchaeota archaeon]|nr:hypothetical protein [Candidatus Woesearchaeota archaeon]
MEAEEFELLGLNKYEALAYEALVLLGKAGASQLARESGVPYGRIYDTLHSLVNKGLAVIIPEKAKRFAPAPPEILEKLLAIREANLAKLRRDISSLKSAYKPAGEEPVEIVQGKRNFYKLIHKMPEPKKYDYTFRFAAEVKPEWLAGARKRIRAGIDTKYLVRHCEESKVNIEKWKSVKKLKIKKFDFDKVAGQILDDKAVFFALVESNTTVLIRDKPFARLMKKLFEAAWEKAEEV